MVLMMCFDDKMNYQHDNIHVFQIVQNEQTH